MLGGRGYIENNIAPQLLRDARILRIFEGPTETLSMFFGSRLHKTPTDYLNVMTAHFNANNAANNATSDLQHTLASLSEQVSQSSLFATPLDANRWLHERSGKLAALATLNMALNIGEKSKATKHWLSQQFDTLLAQTQQYLLEAASEQIGSAAYTEQLRTLPSSNNKLATLSSKPAKTDADPLLRRDPDAQSEPIKPEPKNSQRRTASKQQSDERMDAKLGSNLPKTECQRRFSTTTSPALGWTLSTPPSSPRISARHSISK